MKKVKLMLLSLSILAVVGGTLAFTAKTGAKICTAVVDSQGHCPTYCDIAAKKSNTNPASFMCTIDAVVGGVDQCHTILTQTALCGAASVLQSIE